MVNRYVSDGDHPDLRAERLNCHFDTDDLAARIWGSKQKVRRRREIRQFIENEPELAKSSMEASFLSRLDAVKNAYENAVLIHKYQGKCIQSDDPLDLLSESQYFRSLIIGFDGYPFHVHNAMFVPALMAMADPQQQREWLDKAKRREICGTYAQTEMGHGTALQRLETTATYDPKTEEFVLNSPTLTATKWLPGNLGKSVNYSVVMAILHTGGHSYGPHAFVVPLRHPETHHSLPGVTLGDIGPKVGINPVDNGFLRLANVRIPRRNMLMAYAVVHPNGRFEAPGHSKAGYAAMMHVRSFMIAQMGHFTGMAATIAIRYSCVRRQGTQTSGVEPKILDYRTQQYRLFPQLARALCFVFAGEYSQKLHRRVMADAREGRFDLLGELHALNSGLKSVVSFQASTGIEQCRLGCGGHGYSLASGIPQIFGVAVGGCTYEGDNLVMLLQLSRYLMKMAARVQMGEKPPKESPLSAYLFSQSNELRSTFSRKQSREDQWDSLQKAFEYSARRLILGVGQRIQSRIAGGVSAEEAFHEESIRLNKSSRSHIRTFLCRNFIESVRSEQNPSLREVLSDVLHLYLHYEVEECRADLFADGYFSAQQYEESHEELNKSLGRIRPNAVNLVDSFDFCDRELMSVLGRSDGRVYEELYEWAQKSPLNQTDVLPFHQNTLGWIMRNARENSKL